MPEIVGAVLLVEVAWTLIAYAGSEDVTRPSLTRIVMFEYVLAVPAPGVPDSAPFVVLNVAQDGRLAIENVSGLPSRSEADGRK